ncbi:MAG: hypothetical protein AAFX99_23435 [Myxococcota bacterium]
MSGPPHIHSSLRSMVGLSLLAAGLTLSACGGESEYATSCTNASDCNQGQVCVDGACQDEGASCTSASDCDQGQVCVDGACQDEATGCDTPDPSLTCQDTGCPDGQVCLPSNDRSCVPSVCSCEGSDGWVCTSDCGQPYACTTQTVGGDCDTDDDCQEGAPSGEAPLLCIDGTCQAESSACNTPNPSITCQDTGCPEGQVCLPTNDASCVSSSCTCEDGSWLCTDDCGQPHACTDDIAPSVCPEQPPIGRDEACAPNTECNYGQECCCGECYASTVCLCDANGQWSCFASDACFNPSCEGRLCDTDTDCESSFSQLSCVEGICQELAPTTCDTPDPSINCLDTGCPEGQACVPSPELRCAPSSCTCDEGTSAWSCEGCDAPMECVPIDVTACEGMSEERCAIAPGCGWFYASACPSDEFRTLTQNACLPNIACNDDSTCPTGTACTFIEVLPGCAIPQDPNDPVCDACSSVAQLCLPTP